MATVADWDVDDGPIARWRAWWDAQLPAALRVARGFVVTTEQLRAAGTSRAAARHAVRTGRWTAAGRGAVALVDVRDPDKRHLVARRTHAVQAAAETILRPGHVTSGRSAAIQHGLPTLNVPTSAEVTARRDVGNGRRGPAHVHRAGVEEDEVVDWYGAPVLDVARTVVDLARHDRWDGLMAADAALRESTTSTARIGAALDRARQWPGVRQAREVLALADPRAESPLESITRLRMHDDGFPPVTPQLWIGRYRVDLAVPELGLVVEADGRVKYATGDVRDDALWQEKQREEAIRRAGWWVERVLWTDVLSGWPATSRRLWASPGRSLHPLWS